MSVNLADYDYSLPDSLIALKPVVPRDQSRLMSVKSQAIEHRHRFYELPTLLCSGSVLVFNNTKVMPARLQAYRNSGANFELLVLNSKVAGSFTAKVKPLSKLKVGAVLYVKPNDIPVTLVWKKDGSAGFSLPTGCSVDDFVAQNGLMPLPPYILKGRRLLPEDKQEDEQDRARYQTIYSQIAGSVAAPTAGLHFTDRVFEALKRKNITCLFLSLDIGAGTFDKLTPENLSSGKLHPEQYTIPLATAKALNQALAEKRKIVTVGTTTARALESVFYRGKILAGSKTTDLFIKPNFKFKVVDQLITNFHLPKSSLSILVHTFGGYELLKRAYQEAIALKYRFYSFGDAMLIDRAL